MNEDHRDAPFTLNVKNRSDGPLPLLLVIEPEASEFHIAPGGTIRIVNFRPYNGTVDLHCDESRLVLFGRPDPLTEVFEGNKKLPF